jgi:hypothetical protein
MCFLAASSLALSPYIPITEPIVQPLIFDRIVRFAYAQTIPATYPTFGMRLHSRENRLRLLSVRLEMSVA